MVIYYNICIQLIIIMMDEWMYMFIHDLFMLCIRSKISFMLSTVLPFRLFTQADTAPGNKYLLDLRFIIPIGLSLPPLAFSPGDAADHRF
jgi:hypothetical protein